MGSINVWSIMIWPNPKKQGQAQKHYTSFITNQTNLPLQASSTLKQVGHGWPTSSKSTTNQCPPVAIVDNQVNPELFMIVKSILFISFPQVLYETVHHSFHFTRHVLKRYVQTTPAVNSSTDCRADCREERRDSAEARWSSSSEVRWARLTSWLSVQQAADWI